MIALAAALTLALGLPVQCAPPAAFAPNVRAYYWTDSAGGRGIKLNEQDCASLADLAATEVAYVGETDAVMVLAHEYAHSLGVTPDVGANCVGGTMIAWIATRIGLAPMAQMIYRQFEVFTSAQCSAWAAIGDRWAGPENA